MSSLARSLVHTKQFFLSLLGRLGTRLGSGNIIHEKVSHAFSWTIVCPLPNSYAMEVLTHTAWDDLGILNFNVWHERYCLRLVDTIVTGSSSSQPKNQDAPIKTSCLVSWINSLVSLLFSLFLVVAASGEHGNKSSTYHVPGLPCGGLSDLTKATKPVRGSSLLHFGLRVCVGNHYATLRLDTEVAITEINFCKNNGYNLFNICHVFDVLNKFHI